MKRMIAGLVALSLAFMAPLVLAAGSIVTQLERDHIDISARFNGDQISFFGALSAPGDVVVKLVSPAEDVALSEKAHVGPVWVDGGHVVIRDAPGLFYLASTRPIDKLLSPAERDRYGLSLQDAVARGREEGKGVGEWQQAFIHLKKVDNYYREQADAVSLVKNKLFFTRLQLPPKLSVGKYELHAYLVRDGKVVAEETKQLDVRQAGLVRWVSSVAHVQPWAYGVLFTLFCMSLGLGLSMLLRRDKDD